MARTDLTTQVIIPSGTTPSYSAANVDGNMFVNNGAEFLHVINGSGGSINVTLTTPATVDGLAIEDPVIAVGAGADAMIGPFNTSLYNQKTGVDKGKVYVDYSGVTSLTVGVFRA